MNFLTGLHPLSETPMKTHEARDDSEIQALPALRCKRLLCGVLFRFLFRATFAS